MKNVKQEKYIGLGMRLYVHLTHVVFGEFSNKYNIITTLISRKYIHGFTCKMPSIAVSPHVPSILTL